MCICCRQRPNVRPSTASVLCSCDIFGSVRATPARSRRSFPTAVGADDASRISATIEFGLPSIASAIERDVPRRLATIDERIGCVNKRVLVFRIRANCDVDGFVDRGAMSLYGRGDHVVGSIPIFGTIEGQGANRFTSRIHGDAEGGPWSRSNPGRN
jgi:hypothetical protein